MKDDYLGALKKLLDEYVVIASANGYYKAKAESEIKYTENYNQYTELLYKKRSEIDSFINEIIITISFLSRAVKADIENATNKNSHFTIEILMHYTWYLEHLLSCLSE